MSEPCPAERDRLSLLKFDASYLVHSLASFA